MDPKVWGPDAWNTMHSIANNYPVNPSEDDKHNTRTFFLSIGRVLPCYTCRVNYQKHLVKLPLTDQILSTRVLLSRWVVDIHNEVNKMTNKPVLSYEEADRRFKNRTGGDKLYRVLLVGTLMLISLLILYMVIKKRYR